MNPQWQYNHLVIPFTISIIINLCLIFFSYRHHNKSSLGKVFIVFMIFTLIWLTASLMEIITLDLELSLFFADLSFLAITFFPVLWLGIVMIYIGLENQLRGLLPVLIIPPIVTNIVIWTNSFHQLWRGNSDRDLTTTWFPITEYEYGVWFYTGHLAYSLVLVVWANVLLIRCFFVRQDMYRTQILTLILALNLPLLVDLLYRVGFQPITYYNASTLVFPFSGLLLAWVISEHNFLDITPIARDLVVESMDDLMLVLDHQGRILDYNPAARDVLFKNYKTIIGQDINHLLEHAQEFLDYLSTQPKTSEVKIEIADNLELIYQVSLSDIIKRGKYLGQLVLLHNITDRKHAEKAYIEQSKQMGILEERQRLARELHDSVNQTLFAAGTLANLLPMAIEKKPEKITKYASDIKEIIAGTSAQMRLVLMELHPNALVETDLGTLIKHLCDAHTGRTGTPITLQVSHQIILEKDDQIAFYRIAQEALHNISKHTQATRVYVNLTRQENNIQLTIGDNGNGFDINHISTSSFGLSIMNERARNIGASLLVESDTQIGTCVKLRKGIH